MARFEDIKSIINTYIKPNGKEEITGEVLQNVLRAMMEAVDIVVDEVVAAFPQISGSEFVDVLENKVSLLLDPQGHLGNTGRGLGVVMDKVMSDDSLNPVSNKVVKAYIDKIRSDLNVLVSGDLSSAIDNFNEIIEFLSSIEDSETLAGIIAGLETALKKYADGVAQAAYEQSYSDSVDASSAYTDGKIAALAAVARTGSYNDLKDKPTIPTGGGGATPRVEMTAASAAIEPNKFYVWPMMDSLDLTLGAEQTGVMNRYLFQFRNPKAGLTMLTLPDDITWSEDTELDENGMPVMEATAFYRIEIIGGLASLKKWKLVYINFADAEVERVLMANGIGDGIGITKRDAAAVTDMTKVFGMNESITEFDEFQYFTGVTRLLYDNVSVNHGIGFMGCTSLIRITLPTSLVRFGNGSDTSYGGAGAFYGCANLEYVGNTSQVDYVGNASFYACESLLAIDLSSAIYIGGWAFQNCKALKQVVLSNNLQEIGSYAFFGCESLELDITGKLTLIKNLPLGVFSGTKTTGELSMPNLEIITYGYVKKQAFESANLIKILNLGKISEIPDGYNNDISGVFAKNGNLILVILPETLTYIGNRAFYQDTSLHTIICNAVTPPQLHNTAFNSTNSTFIIYVPDESVEAYKAATNWNTYADRIKGISEYAG